MAAINIAPLPPLVGLGIGFWQDLKDRIAAAESAILDNTESEDSHDVSSDSLEEVNAYDPDVHTVTELKDAIDEIIGSLSAVV